MTPSYKTHNKTICKESSIKQSFQINSDIVCGICKFMFVQCGTLCTLIFPPVVQPMPRFMISSMLQYGDCQSAFLILFVTVFSPFITSLLRHIILPFCISTYPCAGTTRSDKHYDCYFSPVSHGLQLFSSSLRREDWQALAA